MFGYVQVTCFIHDIKLEPSSFVTHGSFMIGFRSELHFIWQKKRVRAFTANVWFFAHRFLTYALVVVLVVSGGPLRVSPLYIAVSFMFLVAYNGIGCVFEGVSRFSEFHIASLRIQVRLLRSVVVCDVTVW